jgi:hypothetical protein
VIWIALSDSFSQVLLDLKIGNGYRRTIGFAGYCVRLAKKLVGYPAGIVRQ